MKFSEIRGRADDEMSTNDIELYVAILQDEKARRKFEADEKQRRRVAIERMRQLENELGVKVVLSARRQAGESGE